MPILRLFHDGSRLEFGSGHLDRWSVYLSRPNAARAPAHEDERLDRLEQLAQSHCPRYLYEDYVVIYNRATHTIQPYVFDLIHSIARDYNDHRFEVEVGLALHYAGMVAAEGRHRSRPGMKRQQRLGVHQVLVEGLSARMAATYCWGKHWPQIEAECVARGF